MSLPILQHCHVLLHVSLYFKCRSAKAVKDEIFSSNEAVPPYYTIKPAKREESEIEEDPCLRRGNCRRVASNT